MSPSPKSPVTTSPEVPPVVLRDAALAAAQAYSRALGDTFEASAVRYATGRCLELTGQPEDALQVHLRALSLPTAQAWPYLMNAIVRLAGLCGRRRPTAAALSGLTARLPELLLWQGHLLRLEGALDDALAPLTAADARCGGTIRFTATTERVRCLCALDRHEEALAVCMQGAADQPDAAAHLYCSAAGVLCHLGRPDEALSLMNTVLHAIPELPEAWLNRGAALLHLHRWAEADDALDRCVALSPDLESTVQELRSRHVPGPAQ